MPPFMHQCRAFSGKKIITKNKNRTFLNMKPSFSLCMHWYVSHTSMLRSFFQSFIPRGTDSIELCKSFLFTFLTPFVSHGAKQEIESPSPPEIGNFAHTFSPFTTFPFGQNIFVKKTNV